jgi:hypothetical protein
MAEPSCSFEILQICGEFVVLAYSYMRMEDLFTALVESVRWASF